MDNIEISQQDVLNLLLKHESHKSPGPDGIGALFLKQLIKLHHGNTFISAIGFLLWCYPHSLEVCIRMKGSKADLKNYHPVSLM